MLNNSNKKSQIAINLLYHILYWITHNFWTLLTIHSTPLSTYITRYKLLPGLILSRDNIDVNLRRYKILYLVKTIPDLDKFLFPVLYWPILCSATEITFPTTWFMFIFSLLSWPWDILSMIFFEVCKIIII